MTDRLISAWEFAKRYWPAFAAGAAFLLLGGAHAFEKIGGLAPCPLCLRQREFHWAVLAIAAAGAWVWRRPNSEDLRGVVDLALAAAFTGGAVVAAYHAGIEWDWWPGPALCAAGGEVSVGSILDALSGPQNFVSCEDAAWRDPVVRLSMAGWNALFSAGLAAASAAAALDVTFTRKAAHA